MSALVLGLNYRSAPVALLERMAVSPDRLIKALDSLTAREHVCEAVVVSTCNRVEVYAAVTRYHGGVADLRNFFSEWGGVAPEDFTDHCYDYYEDRAAAHLFAVAAGLDSMVVGERQVNLQVKHAFKEALAAGACGRVLESLFRQALRVARRVRSETAISDGVSSMVDVGLDAAREALGDLSTRSVLIVGAGKIGGMAARRLHDGCGELLIANRTEHRAGELAARVGGSVVAMSDLSGGLRRADLVLCSTAGNHPVIEHDDVVAALAGRANRPLVLLDLTVPRDVDEACQDVPGVTVLDIDDLRTVCESDRTTAAVAQAQDLVNAEAAAFADWTRTVQVEPTIASLRQRAEGVRVAELQRLRGRFAGLDERQQSALEALTKGIVNTLLHEPTVRLKAAATARGDDLHAAVLRELFDLEPRPDANRE